MTQGSLGLLEYIALPLVFIAGCLFAIENVRERRSHRIARRSWTRTTATVTRLDYRERSFGVEIAGHSVGTGGRGAYYPTLTFRTPAGAEVTGEPIAPVGSGSHQGPAIGKEVGVLYDPSCPHAFYLVSRTNLRMGTLAAVIGIVVPLVFLADPLLG